MSKRSPILAASDRFLDALDRQSDEAIRLILRRYEGARRDIAAQLEALLEDMQAEGVTRTDLYQLERYRALLQQISVELGALGQAMTPDVKALLNEAATAGAYAGIELGGMASDNPAVVSAFTRMDAATVARAVAFTSPGSPLMQMLEGQYGQGWANVFAQQYISGVALGWNPRRIVSTLMQTLEVAVPADVSRIVRTAQLWTYRDANMGAWRASGVVDRWRWSAHLGLRTCFVAGTLIDTRRGAIPIERVKRGDEVLTHTGAWRKVVDTMSRHYSGDMVTLIVNGRAVACTADHKLLCERHGKLEWVRAGSISLGDRVVSRRQDTAHVGNHSAVELAIEGCGGDSDNRDATRLQPQVTPLVSSGDFVVPVGFIYLDSNVSVGHEEINGVMPDAMLLQVMDTERVKTEAGVPFGFGFPFIAPIASEAAETTRLLRRYNTELLAATKAGEYVGRAAALLGAMAYIGFCGAEHLAATLAGSIHSKRLLALHRAVDMVVNAFSHVTTRTPELFAAHVTGQRDTGFTLATFNRAIVKHLAAWGGVKRFAAHLANKLPVWLRWFTANRAAMRMLTLISGVAGHRTEVVDGLVFAYPSGGAVEMVPTSVASEFNLGHVQSVTLHSQSVKVYDLTVEQDHSFVANGIVAHNCMSCWAMHGSIHPISETLQDHHNGRCAAIPLIAGDAYPPAQTGEDAFRRLSPTEQERMADSGGWGPHLRAWKDGAIQFSQVPHDVVDAIYGAMRVERSLKALLGDNAARYYGR